jgi:hypothetical protein
MSPRRQAYIAAASTAPYRSTACRIGIHQSCAESSPASAPVDLPVVYEACDCPCHAASKRSMPGEVEQ